MSLYPHYFAAHVFGVPNTLVKGPSNNTGCDYCALSSPSGTQTPFFSNWSCLEPTGTRSQATTVCVFCAQAMRLDEKRVQDGLIYLLPELDQASLIHLTVMAYSILSASAANPASTLAQCSNTDNSRVSHISKTYCVKSAQAFLSTLNRVGVERWQQLQIMGWRPEYLMELVAQLRALPAPEWRSQALQGVAQTMRYVPIRSAHNTPYIELIAQSHWARPGQFEYWFKRFQWFKQRLQQKEQTDAKY